MGGTTLIAIITFLISAAVCVPTGMVLRKKTAESKIKSAESEAEKIIQNAKKEAENTKKEEILKAKEEILKARTDLDEEIKERRGEIGLQEKRIIQKEENLERRADSFEKRERELERKFQANDEKAKKLEELEAKQTETLQRISGLSGEEAKKMLLEQLDRKLCDEKAALMTPDKITIKITKVTGECNKVAILIAIGVVTARVANAIIVGSDICSKYAKLIGNATALILAKTNIPTTDLIGKSS